MFRCHESVLSWLQCVRVFSQDSELEFHRRCCFLQAVVEVDDEDTEEEVLPKRKDRRAARGGGGARRGRYAEESASDTPESQRESPAPAPRGRQRASRRVSPAPAARGAARNSPRRSPKPSGECVCEDTKVWMELVIWW